MIGPQVRIEINPLRVSAICGRVAQGQAKDRCAYFITALPQPSGQRNAGTFGSQAIFSFFLAVRGVAIQRRSSGINLPQPSASGIQDAPFRARDEVFVV